MLYGEKMRRKLMVGIVVLAALIVVILLFMRYDSYSENAVQQNITVGSIAPDYGFFLSNGSYANLSAYKGHTVVLWFVATWCPSCAQGNEVINQNYEFFKKRGIKLVELELYKDLGYRGQPIIGFVNSYAPSAYSNGTIIPALAGYNMTAAYDPKGYLDIYYLISPNGTILYISGSPESTLSQLEGAINNTL